MIRLASCLTYNIPLGKRLSNVLGFVFLRAIVIMGGEPSHRCVRIMVAELLVQLAEVQSPVWFALLNGSLTEGSLDRTSRDSFDPFHGIESSRGPSVETLARGCCCLGANPV
jgi:hypothetical protein